MSTDAQNREAILCTAVFAAKDALGLSDDEFAAILHLDHVSIGALQTQGTVKVASEQGDIAKGVIRIEQALRAMVGGDRDNAQHWIHSNNHSLKGIPVELMQNEEGRIRVLHYLHMVSRSS